MRSTGLVGLGLVLILASGCHQQQGGAKPYLAVEEPVTAISHCREHISLRNTSSVSRNVTLVAVDGTTRRVMAIGRDTTTNLAYTATVVVLSSPSSSVRVSVDGQQDSRVRVSTTPCVRPLPATNPDEVELDYTFASASARGPDASPTMLTGVVIVTFAASATRAQIDSLVLANEMALIGGRRGPTSESDVWGFWIEDEPKNTRTRQLIRELRQSNLVRFALPYILIEFAHADEVVLLQSVMP